MVDLETAERVGVILAADGLGAKAAFELAASVASDRAIRVAAPLFVRISRRESAEALEPMRAAAQGLRARGLPPSLVGALIDADDRDADETVELVEAARRAGVGFVLAVPAARLERMPSQALDALREVAARGRTFVHVTGLQSIRDLVATIAMGLRCGSGPAFGGMVGGAAPPFGANQRKIIELAQAMAGVAPLGSAYLRREANELRQLTGALAAEPATEDLAALWSDLSEPLHVCAGVMERAESLRARATSMARAADEDLTKLWEAVACGRPPRLERIERAEVSLLESMTLREHAFSAVREARCRAAIAKAGTELRRQSLRAAVAQRRARLVAVELEARAPQRVRHRASEMAPPPSA
ncbi:MAG: hypothetical protein HOW73_38410 [Polyangiaceae bacterium]|nr:hypothetical protein [Polyangiaceae bacterium]